MKYMKEVQAITEKSGLSENNFPFNIKPVVAVWLLVISISFTLGGLFFNAKELPKAVTEIKIEVAGMKSDIKNLTSLVLEIQKCLLSKK